MQAIDPRRIRIYIHRAAAKPPIRSSFGLICERSLLLIAVDDHDGNTGWGEVWTGLPAFGARHRAQLLETLIAPQVLGATIEHPTSLQERLANSLLPVVRLAGEPGPVSQTLAGLDCALWDLAARRERQPLYRLLGGPEAPPSIPVYASGIAPQAGPAELDRLRSQGFTAFKLKAGYDDANVLPAIRAAGRSLLAGESMMIDANCGWNIDEAIEAVRHLDDTPLEWVEEPIGPERPAHEWTRLAAACRHPLAAGENLLVRDEFERAFDWLGVLQPDLGKWGGVSQVLPLARHALASGLRYCPHAFGSNVGVAHAAHVLAAAGGGGRLEMDANPNPLRHAATAPLMPITDGCGTLGGEPGIGLDVDLEALAPFLQYEATVEPSRR